MRYRSVLLAAMVAAALASGAVPAAAQDMATVMPNSYVLSDILNKQRVDAAIGASGGGSAGAPAPRLAPRPAVPTVSTTYRPSPTVSVQVRRQFSAWMGTKAGLEGGRRIAEALASADPVASWAGIVRGDGLVPGDLTDALAGYWILNWAMANGGDNNRAQALAVRDQVRTLVVANPTFARLGEPERQEMAETFMLNFLIQHAAYVDAMKRGDQATQRRLGDAAVARFRNEMGVDLRQLALTNSGFIRRG